MDREKVISVLTNRRLVLLIVALVTVGVSLQQYFLGPRLFDEKEYTHYNNYVIFTEAFHHLVVQEDLYSLYPEEHWDYYKYSPTFALFMGPFAQLPDWLGIILWNLLNAFILILALFSLRKVPANNSWMVWIILIELVTSMQNSQSNAIMAGLVIFAFHQQDEGKPHWASLLLALSIYVKLFSLVALSLALFSRDKFKFGLYWLLWMIVLFALPLMVVTPQYLLDQYQSWWQLLREDHSLSLGLSVMGWLQSWFHFGLNKQWVVLIGAIIYMIPFLRVKEYSNPIFRLWILASVLLWMVVFNHKAESPTFIIALAGVAIWFLTCRMKWYDITLLVLVIIFTSLSPTDIFPGALRKNVVEPYVLKAVPCIFVWIRIVVGLIVGEEVRGKG